MFLCSEECLDFYTPPTLAGDTHCQLLDIVNPLYLCAMQLHVNTTTIHPPRTPPLKLGAIFADLPI